MDKIKLNSTNRGVPMYNLDDMPEEMREKFWTYFLAKSRENGSPNMQGINVGGFMVGWTTIHEDF